MAILYGLHSQMAKFAPNQRHPSEPIENIFSIIDHVIDLNNPSGKIWSFRKMLHLDGGTSYLHT